MFTVKPRLDLGKMKKIYIYIYIQMCISGNMDIMKPYRSTESFQLQVGNGQLLLKCPRGARVFNFQEIS